MLECIEKTTGDKPTHSVIWLHGLGADGHDFEPVVPELVRSRWPPLRFVFPHAPVRPITINGGLRMRGWYDILGMELARIEDEAGIRESMAAVRALIERESTRGIEPQRVLLAGFSQGGAIALATALTHPQRLAGVMALSTYLPIAARLEAERNAMQTGLPVFCAHGAMDPIVPQTLGAMTAERLRGWGFEVEWRSYPMPHSVCAQEIGDIGDWMERRLSSEQR